MFCFSIRTTFLLNLTLLLYCKIQKHNQIRAKSLRATTKCCFNYAFRQNIEIPWFGKICLVWALNWFEQPLFNLKPSIIFSGTRHLYSITLETPKSLTTCHPHMLTHHLTISCLVFLQCRIDTDEVPTKHDFWFLS